MSAWRTSSFSANGACAEVASWRKSTYSAANGNCAEVGSWRKSSHSAYNGSCAEVGSGDAVIGVRDSKDPGGPVLTWSSETWERFVRGVKHVGGDD